MRTYLHFSSIDSTNRYAKKYARELSQRGFLTCITADQQTQGYGTKGNSWVSPIGNLYATLFFSWPHLDQSLLPHLPQLLALACVIVLKEEGIFLEIKWPNDLIYNEKKCAGILAESFYLDNKLQVALGFGLNVNTSVEGVDQPVISLREITGRWFDLKKLLDLIVIEFEKYLHADFTLLQSEIQRYLILRK